MGLRERHQEELPPPPAPISLTNQRTASQRAARNRQQKNARARKQLEKAERSQLRKEHRIEYHVKLVHKI